MPSRNARGVEAGSSLPPSRAGQAAWVARAMLALVPLAILGVTVHHVLQQRVEERWRDFSEEFRRVPLPGTSRAVDEGIEEAFAPVYAGIPALLDWHYSFGGQFTELFLAVFGGLEEEVESRLLAGLEERIGVAGEDVGGVMQEEMLTELERWFGREVASLPPGLRTRYERMLEPILGDATRRFAVSVGPLALGAALAGMGTSVAVTALANQFAGKMLSLGVVSAAGRALRPFSGVAGGIAGGLLLDAALRELDEAFNREVLEQALTALVDEEKRKVKSAMSRAVDDVKFEALGDFTPFELGSRPGQPARASAG